LIFSYFFIIFLFKLLAFILLLVCKCSGIFIINFDKDVRLVYLEVSRALAKQVSIKDIISLLLKKININIIFLEGLEGGA